MDLSVVLATYNRSTRLQKALDSLGRLSVPAGLTWELIVVDNNSNDGTRQIVEGFARGSRINVQYIFEGAQGKSVALNTGVRRARGEIIAFTDDDVTADSLWLFELYNAFSRFGCLTVAGRVVPVWNRPQPDWLDLEDQQAVVHFEYGEEPREISIPPIGANMACRREVFEKYGLFRVGLSVYKRQSGGTEDMEFGWRLLRAREKILYVPSAVIYHPVDENRATKKYVLRWAYSLGRKMSQARLWPADAVSYFGVPRYLLKNFVQSSLKYVATADTKKRFRYKVRIFREAGEILAALQQPRVEPTEIPRLIAPKDSYAE